MALQRLDSSVEAVLVAQEKKRQTRWLPMRCEPVRLHVCCRQLVVNSVTLFGHFGTGLLVDRSCTLE